VRVDFEVLENGEIEFLGGYFRDCSSGYVYIKCCFRVEFQNMEVFEAVRGGGDLVTH